jgi:hypothetical protein
LLSHEAHPGGQAGAARQGEGEVAAAGRHSTASLLILLLRRPALLKLTVVLYIYLKGFVMLNVFNDIFEKSLILKVIS